MTGQMMPPPTGWMWGGFFEWQLRDKDGNIEQEGGGPNMLHQLGQQEVLNAYFAPDIATVLESDAIYDVLDHADGSKCIHSASGTDDPFATVTAGDMVYIAGGAAAAEMVPGLYEVASVGVDYENILLARDPGADQLTGGLVVLSLNRGMGVIEPDASFDLTGHEDGEICLYSTAGTQDSFVGLAAGDMLYLVGGLDNEVTPGLYEVASVGGDYENVLLTAAPYAGDVTGGIVVFRVLQKRLALALDNRSALSVTDTAAGLASYEEDGDGYARVVLDPMDSGNWTVSYSSDQDAYMAVSAVCTFTASGTNWQANRNMALVSYVGPLATPTSEVLIGSMSLGGAVTVADTKFITVRYSAPIRGAKT